MTEFRNDIRLQELKLLTQLERERWVKRSYKISGGGHEMAKERQMVLSLIMRDMLNGPDTRSSSYSNHYTGENIHNIVESMKSQDSAKKGRLIEEILTGVEVELEMGHLGRLRLFELQDQLKATRIREAFGILFDGRHVERDLAVAIMNSGPTEPVSIAYLDMNGLKAINEDGDHATGDTAIKTFFQTIEKAVSGIGDAYRKGGDEVIVVMPSTPIELATKCMRATLASLAKEEMAVKGSLRRLSSACGLVSTNSPGAQAAAEIHRADLVQKKAKAASKQADGTRMNALVSQTEAGETEELI